jgi:hypothetical protein
MEAIPLGKSRGGTPADERARKARAASLDAAVVPAFAGVPLPSIFSS